MLFIPPMGSFQISVKENSYLRQGVADEFQRDKVCGILGGESAQGDASEGMEVFLSMAERGIGE